MLGFHYSSYICIVLQCDRVVLSICMLSVVSAVYWVLGVCTCVVRCIACGFCCILYVIMIPNRRS